MPLDPHIDTGAPARFMLAGFDAGANAGASRGHLDIQRADLGMRQQEFAQRQAERDANDEVWRAVADYAMKGMTLEDFAADHMPNSEMGQRALAAGRGSAGQAAMSQGAMMGPQPMTPGADPTMDPLAMGQGNPPMDAGAMDATDPQAAAMGMGGGMAAIPPQPHPDDERLRRALQRAPAHAIQQALPHLQDERKRRALTTNMNFLIDQGLHDNVMTPHLKGLMQYYAQAGEPDFAVHELARAYEEHGKHQDAMELEAQRESGRKSIAQLASDTRLQAAMIIHAKGAGQTEEQFTANLDGVPEPARTKLLTAFRVSGKNPTPNAVLDALTVKNDPQARLVATTSIEDAKQSATDAEKEYKSVNEDGGGKGLAPPTQEELSMAARPEAPGWLEKGNDKTWEAAKRKVEAWHKFEDAKHSLHDARQKVIKGKPDAAPAPAGGSSNRQQAIAQGFAAQFPGVNYDPANPQHVQALQEIAAKIPRQ